MLAREQVICIADVQPVDDSMDHPCSSPVPHFYSPMLWSTPQPESPLISKPQPEVDTARIRQAEATQPSASPTADQDWPSPLSMFDASHSTPGDDFFNQSMSYGSTHTHFAPCSSRLSSSTLASSAGRTTSNGSAMPSPNTYGFAFGSPKKDRFTSELHAGSMRGDSTDAAAIGLGLSAKGSVASDEQYANVPIPVPAGPFSHHRTPSWTLSSQYSSSSHGGKSSMVSQVPPTIREGQLCTAPPLVPARNASRSRSNSSAASGRFEAAAAARKGSKSSITSTLSRNVSVDEMLSSRPGTAHSVSSNSITSSTHDFSTALVNSRSSSLKKARSRPSLVTKASEPMMAAQRPHFHSISRSKSGSLGAEEAASGKSSPPLYSPSHKDALPHIQSLQRPTDSTDLSKLFDNFYTIDSPEDIYYTAPLANAATLAVTLADEGKGVFVQAEGNSLNEVENLVGPKTTHLLLAGCQDATMLDFLERILPVMSSCLVVLDVSQTGLTRLPDALIQCALLEELNISANPLGRPWKDCGLGGSLSNLRVLIADECQFTLVPRVMGELRGLKTLSIRRNNLSHVPSWLHHLRNLERLYLEGNSFQGAWQRICEAFIPATASANTNDDRRADYERPAFTRGSASAPCRATEFSQEALGLCHRDSAETLEEIADEPPATAPAVTMSRVREERSSLRPLMRRMLSSSSDNGLRGREDEPTSPGEPMPLSARTPSMGAEGGEKKWETLMRKLARKASNSQLTNASMQEANSISSKASDSVLSSPSRSRSNSTAPPESRKQKVTYPLTPVGWHDSSNDSPTARHSKRTSYLAISQGNEEATHRRKLRALMQYLEDLDDLSALRIGPPGSILPMETSMASQYSTPIKGRTASMNRTGSETSRESSLSDTSTSSQGPPESIGQAKDDAHRRVRIVQEIVATEQSYIRGLQELVDIYVLPSAGLESSSGQPMIPSSERRMVFSNIEGILHFHQGAFLPALQAAASLVVNPTPAGEEELRQSDADSYNAVTAGVAENVALVFSRHAAFFRMYSSYVNNVDTAQKRVSQWKLHKTGSAGNTGAFSTPAQGLEGNEANALSPKERKRIRTFLQRARSDPRHTQLSLETYLHLPVQRIPRYRLLFEDMLRSCPSYRLKDSSVISSALESICSIATLMNESKRQSEKDRKLLEWQARVRGHFPSPLVQPHRRLIRDGNLTLKRVVMRTTAFHMARNQMIDEENGESLACDGAVTDTDLGIVQVDCLDQQCMEKSVSLLLCNDITVVVVQHPYYSHSTSAPVDLFAVLRIQGSVQIIGETSECGARAICSGCQC